MKTRKIVRNSLLGIVCLSTLVAGTGCSSIKNTWNGMSQTGQGATAGGAAGAAVGAGVGALIGGGKGTWIGALVGAALGAGTGSLIGNQMQKQKKDLEKQLAQLQAQQQANTDAINANANAIKANADAIKVLSVKDSNDLDAIKIVLGDAVLFPTGSYNLSTDAEAVLSRVAYNLDQFPDTDVTVVGYTDNTGTESVNQKLSLERAQSVENYLEAKGVAADRLKAVGDGWNNPIASNSTAAGRAQNRRVEIFITANKQMIAQAESQAK
ncbi:MAG: OmpA family protein [Muribaculaceae bacterium]|nr:OmpA family protein [Bacteroides sp.]MDE6680063.1 OmpA family protein [Muribaculaceae bacterium]